jgi:hypothetical protein
MSMRHLGKACAYVVATTAVAACGAGDPGVPDRLVGFLSVHGTVANPDALRRAHEGLFDVQKRETELLVPIDWRMDPHSDRSWRFWLHSWTFLEPVLLAAAEGDTEALELGVRIAVDWVENNVRGAEGISEFAWYDMAVGARAACLGFLARVTSLDGHFAEEHSALLRSAVEHGEWLAADGNYVQAHNHGLYEDAGLALLCMQLPEMPLAGAWYRKARARFVQNVGATVQMGEGFHLEHSPAYHVMILELIKRMAAAARFDDSEIEQAVRKMRERTAWLVLPDGCYAQFGDTDLEAGPEWLDGIAPPEGLLFARSTGLAAVAAGDERLLAVSWYHLRGHKHSDELSFVWFLEDHRFLVDAGRYGYYYTEPGRKYAESSRAHNVLTRADMEFTFRGQKPYGSGLSGAGEIEGWTVIVGHNPLLAPQGLQHRRAWIYRPGTCLFVCDFVDNQAPERPEIRRRFHFGPDVEISETEGGSWRCVGRDGPLAVFHDLTVGGSKGRAVRGQQEPEVQGFTFPANRSWQANWCLELDAPAETEVLVGAFVVGDDVRRPQVEVTRGGSGSFVFVAAGVEPELRLEVGSPDASGRLDLRVR